MEDYEKLMNVEDSVREMNEYSKQTSGDMRNREEYIAELESILAGSTLRNVRAMCMKRFDELASILCPSMPGVFISDMEDCFDSGYAAAVSMIQSNWELIREADRNGDMARVQRFVINGKKISEQSGLVALLRIEKAVTEQAGSKFTRSDAEKVYEAVKSDFPNTCIDDVSFFD